MGRDKGLYYSQHNKQHELQVDGMYTGTGLETRILSFGDQANLLITSYLKVVHCKHNSEKCTRSSKSFASLTYLARVCRDVQGPW